MRIIYMVPGTLSVSCMGRCSSRYVKDCIHAVGSQINIKGHPTSPMILFSPLAIQHFYSPQSKRVGQSLSL